MVESEFWQLVRRHIPDDAHATRIENIAASGISDVVVCRGGIETWVELKVAHGQRAYFRQAQRPWILEHARAGGKVLVLIRWAHEHIALYAGPDAMNCPHRIERSRAGFSMTVDNMPPPLVETRKPFAWEILMAAMFPSGGTNLDHRM